MACYLTWFHPRERLPKTLSRTTCRVPLQALSLRLSILYQRTCVGLGYGS
ncbi:hypothetical protein AG1IA_08122 [Rhizoctonia solani AG-1 IA]|uniref:Uncharacterized protein n=1 Tax=Thanatephorus cucumeris (strain AG1-IA) TaxID=983506 RepID=L8WIW4_THACA|nr:hypothetical protein AG1IA_08122 [Rhizoctonia solani AG-1 IA]